MTRPDRSVAPPSRRDAAPRTAALAVLLALVAVLGGCAGGGSGSSASASGASPAGAGVAPGSSSGGPRATGFPVTVQGSGGAVTVTTAPKAVVSLAPSLTEMLFAIGAGNQVKAVDDQSTYPPQAPRTKLSGFQPSAEAVAGYSPDLVLVSSDANGLVSALTRLKVPVLVLPAPATLEGAYAQELTLGRATGHAEQARQVVDRTRSRIAAAVAAVPTTATQLKVYHELDQTYFSVTSRTFIGDLYRRFGLRNIADGASKPAGGYPQLSAEFVIASAPDLIVLADGRCCGQTPASVSRRPAFDGLPAVRDRRVIAVDDDVASRWGPRVADFADQIARALGAKV